jgi:hypothetical protein
MDFIIATLFPEKVNKEINKLKREISKLGPKSELDWPPHLVLRGGFDVPRNQMSELIFGFNRFKKDIKPFKIKMEGFEFIENISEDLWIKSSFSISIKVIKSKELDNLNVKLNEFKLFSESGEEIYTPRVVLANEDLDKSSFERIKTFLKDKKFNRSVDLNNITFILNKNNNPIIYKTLQI